MRSRTPVHPSLRHVPLGWFRQGINAFGSSTAHGSARWTATAGRARNPGLVRIVGTLAEAGRHAATVRPTPPPPPPVPAFPHATARSRGYGPTSPPTGEALWRQGLRLRLRPWRLLPTGYHPAQCLPGRRTEGAAGTASLGRGAHRQAGWRAFGASRWMMWVHSHEA